MSPDSKVPNPPANNDSWKRFAELLIGEQEKIRNEIGKIEAISQKNNTDIAVIDVKIGTILSTLDGMKPICGKHSEEIYANGKDIRELRVKSTMAAGIVAVVISSVGILISWLKR